MLDEAPLPSAQPPGQPVWLISFADLISLLLCFFVMLFAMSSIELARWRAVVLSVNANYVGPNAATKSDASEPWLRRPGRSFAGAVADNGVDLDYLAAVLERRVEDDGELAGTVVTRSDDHLVVSLPGDGLFEIGRANINPNARLKLATLGRVLGNLKNQVDVRGHGEPPASARALKVSAVANWELSLARAASVAEELQRGGYLREPTVIGLSDTRYGELSPDLPELERERRARRVDIIVRAYRADIKG